MLVGLDVDVLAGSFVVVDVADGVLFVVNVGGLCCFVLVDAVVVGSSVEVDEEVLVVGVIAAVVVADVVVVVTVVGLVAVVVVVADLSPVEVVGCIDELSLCWSLVLIGCLDVMMNCCIVGVAFTAVMYVCAPEVDDVHALDVVARNSVPNCFGAVTAAGGGIVDAGYCVLTGLKTVVVWVTTAVSVLVDGKASVAVVVVIL